MIALRLFAGCVAILLPLHGEVHRLALADCDDAAFGPNGDLYLACHSPEDRLPIEVRYRKPVPDVMDGYVLRLNAQTGKLIYAVRLSGSSHDAALRVKVDQSGFAYATGITKSDDFPVTPDAMKAKLGGDSDGFLVKFAPDGQIVYSTLIGGSGADYGNGLDLDGKGYVYVGGVNSADCFVCRIGTKNTCRVFGGGAEEKLTGIALDGKGGIYATGYTKSRDFPVKSPVQSALSGPGDMFLTRLTLPALEISFSTFFGGNGDDSGWGVAVDHDGNPVVAGITDSTDLPATGMGYRKTSGGKKDAFLVALRGRKFRATYFGGSSNDEAGYDGGNIQVDQRGNVWVVGITKSDDLPVRNAIQPQFGGGDGDGFIAAFAPDLGSLCFSSYYGGPERNLLEGLAISATGMVAATGVSFAASASPLHITLAGGEIHAGSYWLIVNGQCGGQR
ncbi:MAG: SBBP repeat-containing protein [Acidobacteriia bacterium]|nr:SBBP repeat-containing protein [Terriglobia bacterium]